jgi:hypothetical protein
MSDSTQETTQKRHKCTFSKEEDDLIILFINQYGLNSFQKITSVLPNRTTRQVRERYRLYLDPNINRNPFSSEEDDLLLKLVDHCHQKWSQMTKMFTGRTDVALKYRYNKLSRRLGFLQTKTISNERLISQMNQPIQFDHQPQFLKHDEIKTDQKSDLEAFHLEQVIQDNYFVDSDNYYRENEFEQFCW